MTIKFIIGDNGPFTPADKTIQCIIPDTQLRNFKIYKNGFGDLFEGVHFSRHYQGGIILLNSLEFTNGEQYTIDISEEISISSCCS